MSTNLKTSLQVSQHLPEFVRDENPKFIAFLEAYYEFMEQQTGFDVTTKSKLLRYVADPDESINDFEKSFFETYMTLIPRNALLDKATMVKNILPLYKAKGTPKAFEFLFRILFNEPVEVLMPKNDILRASSGKWVVENQLRLLKGSIYSKNIGDGVTKTFLMAQSAKLEDVIVYINDVETTDFTIQPEYKKINFNVAPPDGSVIKIYFKKTDLIIGNSRELVGQVSGARAIIEKATLDNVLGLDVISVFINAKTLIGSFQNGEETVCNMLLDDGTSIPYYAKTLSSVKSIIVSEGGAGYNVGDPVIITGGGGTITAAAIIDKVFRGLINRVIVNYGGAGFQDGGVIEISAPANAILQLAISSVDTSGNVSANSLHVYYDTIGDYGNTVISSSDYGFPSAISENVNTVIADALTPKYYKDIGPITSVEVLSSLAPLDAVPILNAVGALGLNDDTNGAVINTYGSIGRLRIDEPGLGYEIGDELIFTNKPMNFGLGAAAMVTSVSANGRILKVDLQPPRITGTANISSPSNVTIIGTGTNFTGELRVGDRIMINSESRYVNAIHSSTSLNVNSNFVYATTNKAIGVYNRRIIGGQGYTMDALPTITVESANGTNAVITAVTIMGDGESLNPRGNTQPGQIESILVVSGGEGYVAPPSVDLTTRGDGTATANAILETPYVTLPGRWITSDGILSAADRRIQGTDYYHDYSYVLSAQIEFSKYKDIVKKLLHPSGMSFYGEYAKLDEILTTVDKSNIVVNNELAGTVNVVSGQNIIYGTNTKFVLANTLYLIQPGSNVAVNSEIRTVNSIIDNTTITVTEAFSYNANVQSLVVISVPYNGLGTEDFLEITTENDLVIRV